MACHFTFKDKDGAEITVIGKPAMQAYLADGGLEHLFPGKVFPWMTANDNEVTEKSNDGELGFDLADAFAKRLLDGESFKSILLSRKALTNTVIKSGSIEAKRADELIELAGVIAARKIVEKGLSESETFEELASLAERMPSLNVRTSTSIMDQAYSTPLPIAYIASVRAGITKNTTVTEPTAGNGALLIAASPDKVVANELNKDRFDALKHQGFEVYNKDAVAFNFGSDSDVVIANPPFGVVKDDNGTATTFKINNQYSTNEIDHAIALNALKSMKKDGRAVLIVGAPAKILSDDARSNAYNGKAKRSFYHTLYNQYNVTDHFTVSGDLYAKQGASWPVDVIVIEGTGKSSLRLPAADLPRIINSITELKNELQSNRESLQESEFPIEQGIKTESIADDEGSRASADRKLGDRSNKDDITAGVLPRPGRKPKADGQGQLANADGQYNSSSTRTIRTDNGYDKIENKFQADYTPASKVNSVGTLVPTNMQSSIGEALNRLENKYESIDGFVADQLGYDKKDIGKYFSAEQVDAIALALDNINDGKGFIIGDQTGIGKGRVNAAMIKYAIKNKIVPIFVTEKTNLYGDMIRDLNDIGMTDIKPFITNPAETIPLDEDAQKWYAESLKAKENGEPVPKKYGKFLKTPESKAHTASIIEIINSKNLSGYDVIFTTYSQMQTVSGKKPVRVDFLEAMADGGLVILDESHNAGGVSEIKGKAGKGDSESGEKGGRAAVARRLVGLAKGVFYSSATYAKRPDVLDLYSKTDMGLIADPNALKEALQAGGVPLQQAVASMLAKSGQYIRREKSFDGIAYDTVVAEVDKQFAEKASEVMRDIMRFDEVKALSIKALDDELKSEARKISGDKSTGGAGASSTNFTSVMHNMIGQMLLMLKVQPAIDEALSALKRDEKPVITLSNTMGSAIDEYVKDAGLNPGDAISLNFGDLLKRYLSKSRRVIEGDPFGKKTSRYLTDEELGPSAVKFYKSVEKKIDDYNFASYPVSPIDAIHNALHKEGYRTGEITGRGSIIDYSGNMPIYKRRPSQQTTAAGKRKTINDFNNGLIDVVILNQSGATGLSLHSSPKVGNDTRKRYMIIAQPELNIDTHMQMLGRVNRTGQLITPSYGQLVANVPAEKRPSAILAKKMAMLNAQTTAGKESAVKAKDVPDFMNEYGDEVAASVMNDNRDIHRMLGKPLAESESTGFEKDGAMRKVTGRIPVLSLKDQEMVYSLIEDAYNEYIDILTKTGQNQLEAEAMKLDAKTVSSTQVSPPLSDSNSPFAEGVNAEIVDVKKLGKPYTVDQIKELIAKVGITDANSQKEWINSLTDNIAKEYDNRMAIIEAMPEDDDAEIKRKRGSKDNLNNQKDFVESIINKFHPGKPVRLFSPMGIEYIGYVGNFERKGDAKNYFAQGQWKLTTYVADAAKQFVIPISRLSLTSLDRSKSADTDSSGKWIIESSSTSDVNQALTDGHSESRENRVILTGNMLSAYAFDKTGQIINYTTDSGETKQGIMMPKKFDLAVAIDAKPIQFTNQSIAAEYLNTADRPDYGVRSRDNYFRILPQYNGSMVMYVPSSKTRGGMYFGNKRLIEITGDFVKSGSDMMVRFDKSKLEKILQITYPYSGSLEPISKENGKKFLERENIKLSQSRPKLQGSTIAQIQDMLPAKVKKLSAFGKLVIVQSVQDLPASLFNKGAAQQESLSSATAKRITNAQALYFPKGDQIFLVADSLNKNNLLPVLSHELLHRSFQTDQKLKAATDKFDADLQIRFNLALRGKGTKIELDAAKRVITAKTPQQHQLEEFKAHIVEQYLLDPQSITGKLKRIIADFIAAIRVALVRAGLDFGMVRSLSPSDLFAMSWYGANVDGVVQGDSGVMASTKQLLAPNGKPSNLNPLQWEQVRTPEFKKFFGDWENDPENASKVVDDNGEPLVLFHATNRDIKKFQLGGEDILNMPMAGSVAASKAGVMGYISGPGIWMTDDKINGLNHGKRVNLDIDSPNVMRLFTKLKNPLIIRTNEERIKYQDKYAVHPMNLPRPALVQDYKTGEYKRVQQTHLDFPYRFDTKQRSEIIRDGYDGIVLALKDDPKEFIAFSPNQIKSAIGNTGEFNPDNPDIRFSMRDSVDEINSSIREAFSPRQGKQSLGWLAGLFQRNHLIDFVAKELPMLEVYKTLSQEKDNTINKAEREIAEHYEEMKNSMTHEVMNELGRVQGLATRLKDFDPAKFDDGNPTQIDINTLSRDEKAVYQDYKALPDDAKKAYKMMREDYKSDLLAKKSALIQRLNAFPIDRETKAEIIKQIELHFDQAIKKGVYFPLSRNGDTVVTADKLDDDGNIIPSESIVEFTESGKATDKLMAELKERGYKNRRVDKKAVYIRSLATTNAANNIAALATKAIADLKTNIQQQGAEDILDFSGFTARDIIEGGDFNQLLSDFNQQLIDALPDTSYRKHFIHRKGTLGYSTDTLRAYAGTRTAAAKNIASLLYDHKIYGKIQDAKDAIKEMSNGEDDDTRVDSLRSVLNELELREERLKNSSITQASQILTSLGFMGALGFNVASAAVNMLQVPGVTLPELSGKHGFTKAAAEINKAYKLLFNKDVLNKHSGFDLSKHPELNKPQNAPLRAALIKLNEIGKIDLTLTHEAISMGQNPSYSDNVVTRTVGGIGRYSGYLFHVAEALNRQVTGIAAFNLAYRKNGGNFDEAFKDAVDVIDRTQFDYSQSNRARYMMSDTARVLTLFKSYALGISYYIGRNVHNAIKGETPEIRLAARKMVATQMAMTFATSGLFGLPIGGEALAVLGGVAGFKYKGANFAVPSAVGGMLLFQALLAGLGADDEDDVEVQFRNWLTDNFDQTTAEWIVKGPARLLPMGDISSRTGLSDIWWRPQNKELEGKDQYQAFANALLGPLGSQFAGLFTAMKMYQDGAYSRAIESMSPAAIRNIIAAARMENEGVKTIKGDPIVNRDLTMTEIANKVLGFNPTVVTNNYDANTAIAKARDRIAMKKAHLVNRYIASDPQERVNLMRGDIKDFNSEVEPQERITIGSLIKSIRQRKALDRRTENGLYLSKKSEHLRDIGRFGKED